MPAVTGSQPGLVVLVNSSVCRRVDDVLKVSVIGAVAVAVGACMSVYVMSFILLLILIKASKLAQLIQVLRCVGMYSACSCSNVCARIGKSICGKFLSVR